MALKYHPPGVVTGLAFTPTGGEILFVDATKMPGRGQLVLTGQLGDVMRESAQAASSIIRSRTGRWTVKPEDFSKLDLHIHVPSGAIPKDGPSAGIAILVAMTSVLLNRPVDPTIGMTGEITLSGRVLPIGGVREKVLAAHRAGLRKVVLPARNEPNLEEVPSEVRKEVEFVFVNQIDEVLDRIFEVPKGNRPLVSPKKSKRKRSHRGNKKVAASQRSSSRMRKKGRSRSRPPEPSSTTPKRTSQKAAKAQQAARPRRG
jgi:ATP-dependent Lon protease